MTAKRAPTHLAIEDHVGEPGTLPPAMERRWRSMANGKATSACIYCWLHNAPAFSCGAGVHTKVADHFIVSPSAQRRNLGASTATPHRQAVGCSRRRCSPCSRRAKQLEFATNKSRVNTGSAQKRGDPLFSVLSEFIVALDEGVLQDSDATDQ
jgi:hypothetical protein